MREGCRVIKTAVFDTITGNPLLPINPDSARWAAKIDGSATCTFTHKVQGSGLGKANARDLFRPNARLVAHTDENDNVAAAGLMMRPKYTRNTGKIDVTCVDIRDLTRQRMGFGVGSWGPSGTLTVTNRSLSGAVRAIVSRWMRDFSQPSWMLPIDLPPDGSGSFSRKWDYYGFPTIDDMLSEVEAEGVEVYFDPYIHTDGSLRFQTRVGAPIVGGSFPLSVTAAGSPVTDLQVELDGSKQLTGVLYGGNGTEADTVTAWAGGGPFTIPIRDAYRSAKDVKSVAQLTRIAVADLAEHRDPVEQWSFNVRLGGPVNIGHVRPGRLLDLSVYGDSWIPDGTYRHRVISVSGDLKETVQLEVQSYGG